MNFTDLDPFGNPVRYNRTPQILLYNFASDERTGQITHFLNQSGVSIRTVLPPDFLHPIGYLFELPDFQACSRFNLGQSFPDEMMVMKDFSQDQLNDFLSFFTAAGLKKVSLKSILTPVTAHWDSLTLHKELLQEHRSLQ